MSRTSVGPGRGRLVVLVLVVLAFPALLLAGCFDGSGVAPQTDELDAERPEDSEPSPSDETRDEWQFALELEEPETWEQEGVRVEVTALTLNDATHEDLPSEVADFLDDDVLTVAVLEIEIANDSGETISFNPNQGTLLIAREQVNADLWFTENFGGSEVMDATDDGGRVFWMFRDTSFDDAVANEQLTYIARPAKVAEEDEALTDDVEIVVRWDAP